MSEQVIPTPRTDAEAYDSRDGRRLPEGNIVSVHFARTLETELFQERLKLKTAQGLIDELKSGFLSNEAEIRKVCGKSIMSYPAINAVKELQSERDQLRKALEHYANKAMWRKEVINSYSGECSLFDWPGDLAEEPWEIAENALKSPTQ